MRTYLIFLLLTIGGNAYADTNSDGGTLGILISAKFSGGCGIIGQMATFQQSTQMAGGDEFILRFIGAEAARLGFTAKEYMQRCAGANEIYQTYYDALKKD